MYYAPYTVVFANGTQREFDYISTAAQVWADEEDATVRDANGIEIPACDLYELL